MHNLNVRLSIIISLAVFLDIDTLFVADVMTIEEFYASIIQPFFKSICHNHDFNKIMVFNSFSVDIKVYFDVIYTFLTEKRSMFISENPKLVAIVVTFKR